MMTVRAALDGGQALARLRAVERHAVDGATAEEMAAGCLLLDVLIDGRIVGAVALDIVGTTATITAAKSDGAEHLVFGALAGIEAIARQCGCTRLRASTKRPGLIKKMQRAGYAVSAQMERAL